MTTFEINKTFNDILAEARKKVMKEHGDKGSCVLGMKLLYNRYPIATQIAQGSLTCEYYFEEVKQQLIEKLDYLESGFSIEWGRID